MPGEDKKDLSCNTVDVHRKFDADNPEPASHKRRRLDFEREGEIAIHKYFTPPEQQLKEIAQKSGNPPTTSKQLPKLPAFAASAIGLKKMCQRRGEKKKPGENNRTNCEFDSRSIRILEGHKKEILCCVWSPKEDVLATGSCDATGRMWNLKETENPFMLNQYFTDNCHVLKHHLDRNCPDPLRLDVTALTWHQSGAWLVTGGYDGHARVYDKNGRQMRVGCLHYGPIFNIKWNKKGNYTASGGYDSKLIIWEPAKNIEIQTFEYHTSYIMDLDWINDDTVVSCSVDRIIHICKIGEKFASFTYLGHMDEINTVRFDHLSQRIASGADDKTLKIWALDDDKPVHEFKKNTNAVYAVRWSPLGTILGSGSFDHTVSLWDAQKGENLHTFNNHDEAVYSVEFSPDGRLIASGGCDGSVFVYDVTSGQLVNGYTAESDAPGVFEVGWNQTGEKLAACTSDKAVLVFDMRKPQEPDSKVMAKFGKK